MSKQLEIGSRYPTTDAPEPRLKSVALVQLIAIVTLALSTLIAATAVSIGRAHADAAGSVVSLDSGPTAG
jgi:hypothetical protein